MNKWLCLGSIVQCLANVTFIGGRCFRDPVCRETRRSEKTVAHDVGHFDKQALLSRKSAILRL